MTDEGHLCLDEDGQPLDGEWRACHNGGVYGRCQDVDCGGTCEYRGDCECPCHGKGETP